MKSGRDQRKINNQQEEWEIEPIDIEFVEDEPMVDYSEMDAPKKPKTDPLQ